MLRAFKWFLPISEACWDDGEGGTSGILNRDLSARVLYDAVAFLEWSRSLSPIFQDKTRGCLKMICENQEGQPTFLRKAVEKVN